MLKKIIILCHFYITEIDVKEEWFSNKYIVRKLLQAPATAIKMK